jgi:hypothetical protein
MKTQMACMPWVIAIAAGCGPVGGESDEHQEGLVLFQPSQPTCLIQGGSYWVKAGVSGGTGGAKSPLPSIGAALALAAAEGRCGVVVNIANGTYLESPTLARGMTLRGESRTNVTIVGTISVATGAPVTVENLRIEQAPAPGAFVTVHSSPNTRLDRVTIRQARRSGIRQSGGTLAVVDTTIQSTLPGPDAPAEGSAAWLSGGVQATIEGALLLLNAGGLVLDGVGTHADVNELLAFSNTYNPYFTSSIPTGAGAPGDGFATVEVGHGAVLDADGMTILNATGYGLRVHDASAASVSAVVVRGTRPISVAGESVLGSNVTVLHGDGSKRLGHEQSHRYPCGGSAPGVPGRIAARRCGVLE